MFAAGHRDPLSYTPRQMYFYMELAHQRGLREAYNDLQMMALATQGDQKSVKAQLRALKKEIK